ncbi:MAG TPA: PD-(D/E)XK nuclease family protein [Polyangiaceae bacterium]|nr:PD-(D/E)XK nuclease family protein [Polyangiaceae bacterium]
MAFRHEHLSYSRLSKWEQCPLAFRFAYVDRLPGEPALPLRFGRVVHAALERLFRDVVAEERTGRLDEARALEAYRAAWDEEGLVGAAAFAEGHALVRAFVRAEGEVDHRDVLAIEQEFRLPVGRFELLGYLDRVDRVGEDVVEVLDYKTNRALFDGDELAASLQMSLYALAARALWPWAREVRLTFVMLRHGPLRQTTTRTDADLEAALAYAEALGEASERATEHPPRLGPNCAHCDHRRRCPAYAEALAGRRPGAMVDPGDLEAVAREREEVARVAKLASSRKAELEGLLRAHVKAHGDLTAGGVRYALVPVRHLRHPLGPTLTVLERMTGLARDALLERLGAVDKDALDALVAEAAASRDKSFSHLLRAELDATAESRITPRFWAKPVTP